MTTFKQVSSETVLLTPALAKEHRDLKPSPTERELNERRVTYLKDKINDGLFLSPHWAIAIVGGEKYRMNGQHSARALCESNGKFPASLNVHVDTYEIDSKQEMAMLFRQFDARFSSRSALDVSGAYQGLQDDMSNLDRKSLYQTACGVSWYLRIIEGASGYTGDDVGQFYNIPAHKAFFLWCAGEILNSKTKELTPASVVAAMYGTFIANQTASKAFWNDVKAGNLSDDAEPSQVLDEQLRLYREGKINAKWKPMIFYSKCIKAWNAFREGKKISSLNVGSKKDAPPILQ